MVINYFFNIKNKLDNNITKNNNINGPYINIFLHGNIFYNILSFYNIGYKNVHNVIYVNIIYPPFFIIVPNTLFYIIKFISKKN